MSDKIRFQLDGQEVEAERGMTIWEVANGRGLVIPHLCTNLHPDIAPMGTVVLAWSRLRASALGRLLYPRTVEGMVVHTQNERSNRRVDGC